MANVPTRITAEWLREHGACREALAAYEEAEAPALAAYQEAEAQALLAGWRALLREEAESDG